MTRSSRKVSRFRKGTSKATSRRRLSAGAGAILPPSEIQGLLDRVEATVLALLAVLQDKERTLRQRKRDAPSAGVLRGLADIAALRRWAGRTLRSIHGVEGGRLGEVEALLRELGEFREIVSAEPPTVPE